MADFSEWLKSREMNENAADLAIKMIAKLIWPPEIARTFASAITMAPAASLAEIRDQIWSSLSALTKGQVKQAAAEAGIALPMAVASAVKTIWQANGNIQRYGTSTIESTAFTRARQAAANGTGPSIPDAEINSHDTAKPWVSKAIQKRNKKKKKKC
jgi:hypothetical protein